MRSLTKLVMGIIFVMFAATDASAQIWSIRTQDSVGINPAVPMVGRYEPPPIYVRWMTELAVCENLKLPPLDVFKQSEYTEVNADDFVVNDDQSVAYYAVTIPDSNGKGNMFVSIGHVFDIRIMTHEFLHILLYYNFPDGRYTHDGKTQHPQKYFGTCGVKN